MKKLIVLSGNSQRNEAWGEAAVECFGEWFDEVYLQYYDHWKTDESHMNVDGELSKLKAVIDVSEPETNFTIIAKSIGTLLAIVAIHRGYLVPEKCVFFGMPLDLAAQDLFKDSWAPLHTLTIPILVYHNDADPIANYGFTKETLAREVPRAEFITRSGDNHNYTEFADFKDRISNFLWTPPR